MTRTILRAPPIWLIVISRGYRIMIFGCKAKEKCFSEQIGNKVSGL